MLGKITKKVFGSRNDRLIKNYQKTVERVNQLEEKFQALSDQQLQEMTPSLRQRFSDGEELDQLLPECFATVREASQRVLGMRPYDVQLIGAMVLNDGNIAEMRTGEGKTLMATLAVYLNAVSGKSVHVITVNDYLATRDSEWMGRLYTWLGLTVGVITNGMGFEDKKTAYAADVTYGTNNEFGFDYLRDNMAHDPEQRFQRGLDFAIVDEVDSILIDEARTPLIISGATNETSDLYLSLNQIAPNFEAQAEEDSPGDYFVDEKAKSIYISEQGYDRAEELLINAGLMEQGDSLYATNNISLQHHLNCALRAHALYQKDIDYIVRNNEVVIVDEFTGRTMPGRRWAEGLHQAVEAKEGVEIQKENQTLASITFQNYFRLYSKLSGMTGTADTEAFEFQQIYALEVVVVPTHREMIRKDENDLIYLTEDDKYNAIVRDVRLCQEQNRPVLVGTASIESSEKLAALLKKEKIKHEVLNAKQHEREANIIEAAGMPGAVTIATNMAGRGTDIVLGGNLEAEIDAEDTSESKKAAATAEWQRRHDTVLDSGGLHIIGTERHESRRIDNQLRGRAGRQGDPGSSRFYISLEDNLMRIFASDRMRGMMQKLGLDGEDAIENAWVTRSIENAQRKVEGHNFDIRKNLLEYDDVANEQRKVIYQQRDEFLEAENIHDVVADMRDGVMEDLAYEHMPAGTIEDQWDISGLEKKLETDFQLNLPIQEWLDKDHSLSVEDVAQKLCEAAKAKYLEKEEKYGAENIQRLEQDLMLQILDSLWKDHLAAMDYLRQSVNLRGYAQKNPKQEYKRESFEMFQVLIERVHYDSISLFMRMELQGLENMAQQAEAQQASEDMSFNHPEAQSAVQGGQSAQGESQAAKPFQRNQPKVGRNQPCPCGSGKKFKQCHGKLA